MKNSASCEGTTPQILTRGRYSGNSARPTKHASDDCIYLMAGRLKVCLQHGEHILEGGDSIYVNGLTLRELRALGDESEGVCTSYGRRGPSALTAV